MNLQQQTSVGQTQTTSTPTATKSRGKKYIKQEEQTAHQHIQIQQHHPQQYTQHIQIQPHHAQALVQQNVVSGLSAIPATITIQPQILTTHQGVQAVQYAQAQVMQVQQHHQQQQQQVNNQTDTKIGIILNDDSEYGINHQGELDQVFLV